MARTVRKSSTQKASQPKYPRVQQYQRAHMLGQVYIHNDKRLFIAPLNNISAGGMFISGVTSIPKGNIVRIVVKAGKLQQPIQVRGKVVRIENKQRRGLAVEFDHVSAQTRQHIDTCVKASEVEKAFKVL